MLYNGDCLEVLPILKEKHIDLTILDPPYFQVVNEKWDNEWSSIEEYLIWIEEVIKQIKRVSKFSSSLWVFGFPYQLSFILPIVEKYGFRFRQQIVVWKGLRSVAGRTSSKLKMYPVSTESIYFFNYDSRYITKTILQKKKEKSGLSSKEINTYLGKAINGGGTWSTIAGIRQKNIQHPTKEDWLKLDTLFNGLPKYEDLVFPFNVQTGLTDVWDDIDFYDKTYKKIHPTQKPYSLIERIVKSSTNENDLVLDPMSGSNITGLVCKNLNREYIGIELNKEYFDIAQKRIDAI